jgi:stalled ribosome rescue protein Dom34
VNKQTDKMAVTIQVEKELVQKFQMQARAHGITVDQLLTNGGLIAASAYRLLALCRGDWITIGWDMTRRNGYHLLVRCASKHEKASFDLIGRNRDRKTTTQMPWLFEVR